MFLRLGLFSGILILLSNHAGCEANNPIIRETKLLKGLPVSQGQVPVSGFLEESTVNSKLDCARKCNENENCASMFYVKDTKACKIHAEKISKITENFRTNPAAMYYEVHVDVKSVGQDAPCPSDVSIFQPAHTSDGTAFQFRVFMDIYRSFAEAEALCQSHGAKIYKVLTPEKMAFTLNLMTCPAFNKHNFWGNGVNDNGQWLTTDGEPLPMTSTYWDGGKPNNDPPTCLWIPDKYGYYFDDKVCDHESSDPVFTICEK